MPKIYFVRIFVHVLLADLVHQFYIKIVEKFLQQTGINNKQ